MCLGGAALCFLMFDRSLTLCCVVLVGCLFCSIDRVLWIDAWCIRARFASYQSDRIQNCDGVLCKMRYRSTRRSTIQFWCTRRGTLKTRNKSRRAISQTPQSVVYITASCTVSLVLAAAECHRVCRAVRGATRTVLKYCSTAYDKKKTLLFSK